MMFLKAYALGGGTYTGIEAVSNSTDILREPRAETGKKTMLYMSISLAFTAGGILFCYLLTNVQHEHGRTLNATLWRLITDGWKVGGLEIGMAVVWITLLSEGALLFVAAQTGFVAGPRTLAAMPCFLSSSSRTKATLLRTALPEFTLISKRSGVRFPSISLSRMPSPSLSRQPAWLSSSTAFLGSNG